ncbi:hypothetical protein HPB52_008407 [Rhipicephalus sanguineus]|uniref:HTH psq-type domain-containing protein n=1 Tax=Rhipicephalus sanguineus TaxID=34632 RepID=A0A9D4PD72_RHISA|nr:hypothetical protein HPB52_008407 [Rhipicephalus sanguineus]
MAQAIWGREGLAERSYGGKLAPKDYKNPNAVVRKQLSPHKVALIIEELWLPPEAAEGNVEYKLKLVNPSQSRLEHLVTQMKWRLREGQGEAIYEIGVEDGGLLVGLSAADMAASLATLQCMATKLGASLTVLRERSIGNARKAAEVLVRKVPEDQQSIEIRVAVLGSVDVGKSTVLGVLTQGELDNGRGSARLNLFSGLTGTGRDHLLLALALQVPLAIVVNKVDTGPGFKKLPLEVLTEDDALTAAARVREGSVVPVFLVSCVHGDGLGLLYTFLHVLPPGHGPKERDGLMRLTPEFQIDETFQVPDVGPVVGGLLTRGVLHENDRLLAGPSHDGSFHPVRVVSVQRHRVPCRLVRAGESATLALAPSAGALLRRGTVLCSPADVRPTATRLFRARVRVLSHPGRLAVGFQALVQAVACSAPDHEAAAPAVPVPGLIVDLVTVVCGLSVSTCDEAPRAFTMATRGPYRTLDLATKVKILKEVEQRGTAKQDIARKYGIKPNTLSNILKNKRSVLDAFENHQFKMSRKRMRTGAHPELEQALLIWIRKARSNRLPLSSDIVAAKASSLAIMLGLENFASSDGACGFIPSGADDDASCTVGEEDTSELDVDGLLPALGDVPFEEYVATDSSVETCGALSDAEIVEMVRPSEPSHETEVDGDDAASNVQQAAVVVGVRGGNSASLGVTDRGVLLFKFVRQPECLRPGSRLLFHQGQARGIGCILQVYPLHVPPVLH